MQCSGNDLRPYEPMMVTVNANDWDYFSQSQIEPALGPANKVLPAVPLVLVVKASTAYPTAEYNTARAAQAAARDAC